LKHHFKSVWNGFVKPMLRRPKRVQFAALCYDREGPEKKVLLVTSRGTGRWIVPKGWPIKGLESPETALQEAWEEAGVRRGEATAKPLGSYQYDKALPGDWSLSVMTIVYPVKVLELANDYPEADQRTRKWVAPSEAAELVDEPELKDLLTSF